LEGLGEDGDVGVLAAAEENEAGGAFGGEFEDVGGEEFFGDDDLAGVIRAQGIGSGGGEIVEEAMAEIFDIQNLFRKAGLGLWEKRSA
jgi:hypothetical protein